MRSIFLDFNATTQLAPSVREAMLPFLSEYYGSIESDHPLGRACFEAVEEARSRVAGLVGCEPHEVAFTSSGTEANNLALKGVLLADGAGLPHGSAHVVISALEHASISKSALFLERWGVRTTVVPCEANGCVNPDRVAAAIRNDTRLVSIVHASGELGTVQPIAEIAKRCRRAGVPLHTDAAQTAGKIHLHAQELGADLITVSAHKFYGPAGAGALIVRGAVALEPLLHGAGQEGGLRAGHENVAAIVGLGKSASLVARARAEAEVKLQFLRDRLAEQLQAALGRRLAIYGADAPRLPHAIAIAVQGTTAEQILARLPELHAACVRNPLANENNGQPQSLLRLSFGWTTSQEEIDRAASLLIHACESL